MKSVRLASKSGGKDLDLWNSEVKPGMKQCRSAGRREWWCDKQGRIELPWQSVHRIGGASHSKK